MSKYPRLSAKSNGLSIKVEPNIKTPQGAVTVSIPLKVNPILLNSLKNGQPCMYDNRMFDVTIVAFSTFQRIKNTLVSNATMMAQHKITSMTCGCSDSEFFISAVCDKSMASLRKTSGSIVKGLRFSVMSNDYKKICDMLGVKSDVSAFNFAVDACNKALETKIDIVFTGKINTNKDAVEGALDIITNRVAEAKDKPKGSFREVPAEECKYPFIEYKVGSSGLDAVVLHGYLEQYVNGAFVVGGKVMVQSQYETIVNRSNDKGKIERYVDKLSKLGDQLSGVLSFQGASQGLIPSSSMTSNRRYTVAELKSIISKSI